MEDFITDYDLGVSSIPTKTLIDIITYLDFRILEQKDRVLGNAIGVFGGSVAVHVLVTLQILREELIQQL